jgi:hypothetical protein
MEYKLSELWHQYYFTLSLTSCSDGREEQEISHNYFISEKIRNNVLLEAGSSAGNVIKLRFQVCFP